MPSVKIGDKHLLKYILSTVNDNVKEEKRNMRFNRFSTMRRIKSYHKYSFMNDHGEPVLKSTKVKLGDVKIKDILDNNDNRTYTDTLLPLPITRNCKVIGTINRDEKIKRSLFKNNKHMRYVQDYDVIDMLNVMRPELVDPLVSANVRVFPGDWCYNFNNVIDMCDDSNDKQFDVMDIIDGYFSRAGIDLVLPKLPMYSSD